MPSYWEKRLEFCSRHYHGGKLPSFKEKGKVERAILEGDAISRPQRIGRLVLAVLGAPLFFIPFIRRKVHLLFDEAFYGKLYTQISYENPASITSRLKDVALALRFMEMQREDAESEEITSIKRMYKESPKVLVEHTEGEVMPLIAFLDAILDEDGAITRAMGPDCNEKLYSQIAGLFLDMIRNIGHSIPQAEKEQVEAKITLVSQRLNEGHLGNIPTNEGRVRQSLEAFIEEEANKGEEYFKENYPAVVGTMLDPRAESDLMALLEEYYPFAEKPSNPRKVRVALLTKWKEELHATQFKANDGKIKLKDEVTLEKMRDLLIEHVHALIEKASRKKSSK